MPDSRGLDFEKMVRRAARQFKGDIESVEWEKAIARHAFAAGLRVAKEIPFPVPKRPMTFTEFCKAAEEWTAAIDAKIAELEAR